MLAWNIAGAAFFFINCIKKKYGKYEFSTA